MSCAHQHFNCWEVCSTKGIIGDAILCWWSDHNWTMLWIVALCTKPCPEPKSTMSSRTQTAAMSLKVPWVKAIAQYFAYLPHMSPLKHSFLVETIYACVHTADFATRNSSAISLLFTWLRLEMKEEMEAQLNCGQYVFKSYCQMWQRLQCTTIFRMLFK